ncbi:chymotrypsin inhibitor-like [Zophobas morio]|uniref:chymotrypsin inhibitor-like n=1 Tax=Zophobas morio TaxID=2755281 RepID=UPI0030827335
MKQIICIILIICSLSSIYCYSGPTECQGANEIYNSCGSPCVATCGNRQFANCVAECEAGCFCKDGYLRNDNGICVLPKDCYSY